MEDHKDTIQVEEYTHVRYYKETYQEDEMLERSEKFYEWLNDRRSVRDFSDKPILKEIIDNIILSASTAPSGAHKQPWTFCLVSNPDIKSKIREAAEKEEYESYQNRMNDEWLKALKPIGTDWHKPFLETAPYLIIIFKKPYDFDSEGNKKNNYYVNESVGLAAGFLLTAIHNAGLIALTHTPSPMNFLAKILNRPENERPFLLIPIGYPAERTYVPKLERKQLEEVATYYK
ncbi:MAG: nitroreductase family protein [Cyclobacteriaceae bacterium]|nr:nitroreductase family protein [Cyclobacteriaceae bacterium]